jgi:hypothetical protein
MGVKSLARAPSALVDMSKSTFLAQLRERQAPVSSCSMFYRHNR